VSSSPPDRKPESIHPDIIDCSITEENTVATKRIAAVGAFSVASLLVLSACSSNPSSGGSSGGEGDTLTVWAMDGDYTPETLDAITAEFEESTGAEVDLQIQTWDGITTKISTALATNTPPDILDVGNTQVASYAANGGLLDLTDHADDLAQGQTWLDGLVDPATIDGQLYAVPGFAGARAVIYNKKMWADAGVEGVPATYEELTAALDKVKAANASTPDFSAFYLPGQYWFAGLQFVWDAGGEIATQDGDEWTSGFGTPEAVEGLEAFQEFQNAYSSEASATLNTLEPNQNQIFADGKTSAILNTNVSGILTANPEMTEDDLGTFPMPGRSGEAQPVMLGGSNWAIPAKSQNAELALEWVKIAASPDIQNEYVYGVDGWIPNSTEGIEAAEESLSETKKGFFTAALTSKATPPNPNWTTIESNKDVEGLFSSIASGSKSPEDAAEAFDTAADKTLNGQ
jgi:N,N'-diacetylchitobiose transport system substrate-binding protein